MASLDASELGVQLDNDHLPETKGRMAVCRRCGVTTDGPMGRLHLVGERDVDEPVGGSTCETACIASNRRGRERPSS